MGKAVAVSFEGENVRVVYASLSKKGIEVDDVLILKDEQFDEFLEKEKTKEFTVVFDFKNFYQDIISIPPVKKRYVKKLIEAEIRKRAADFKEFSFIHFLHGEKIIENKRVQEIFVFAVKKEDLESIISRFVNKDKIIKAIYPNVFSVAGLVQSIEEPFLCIAEIGVNKILFLLKDGLMQFVRDIHSFENGINDLDIQNINMTINYCRQTMRINPSFIMLMGGLCNNYSAAAPPSIPVVCLAPIFFKSRINNTILDFIFPVSAFFITGDSKINLLTREYKNFCQIRLFLRCSTILLLSLSIIGIFYAGFMAKSSIESRNQLNSVRMNSPGVEGILSPYENKKTEIAGYQPFITSLNNVALTPDIQRFLSLLSGIRTDNIRIDSISITTGDGSLKGELKGLVRSEGYASMQMYYQQIIDSISGLKGFSIKRHNIELKDRTFQIEVEYR